MPENDFSGKACVSCAIFAIDSGRIAGPPRPPLETRPSTFISNSSVSGSISGSDGKVFDDVIAAAPPRNAPPASTTMSVVDGVSLAQIGTRATSCTACVTIEISPWSLPIFDPMSLRSMWGHERFSSSASAPSAWQAVASVCQWRSSSSLPDPAMIEATRMRDGCACLMRAIRGTHQSSALSEMSSQFHDECSAVPGRFCIDSRGDSGFARRNFVFGPSTFTTGCSPIVLVTTPPQPASNARMMLLSDSVGGAEDSRNGFVNFRPVNVTERSGFMGRIIRGLEVLRPGGLEGKAERVPAIDADIFGEAAAPGQEPDEVPGNHADRGVPDHLGIRRRPAVFVDLPEERVPAEACVLLKAVARADMPHVVPEQPA